MVVSRDVIADEKTLNLTLQRQKTGKPRLVLMLNRALSRNAEAKMG